MGVKAMNTTEKTGSLVALDSVSDEDDLLVTTRQGVVIRTHVDGISKTSRATQGVKIITLKDKAQIASISVVEKDDEEKEELENTEENNTVESTEKEALE